MPQVVSLPSRAESVAAFTPAEAKAALAKQRKRERERERRNADLPAARERERLKRLKNPDCHRRATKKWYDANAKSQTPRRVFANEYEKLEAQRAKVREWRERNPERIKAYRERTRAEARARGRKWLKTNPIACVRNRLRVRLANALKSQSVKKTGRTFDLLGCTGAQLKFWIESQFSRGMNWGNRSEWQIDHKIPVASFDLSKQEEQKKCFHYTNLRPLWKAENKEKGDKIIPFPAVQMDTFLAVANG